jgi:hypothetical protein
MMLKASLDHLIRYLTRCSTEISSRPKVPSPLSLLNLREFFKKLCSTSIFYSAHYFTRSHCRRSRHKYVNMVFAHYTAYYPDLKCLTCLPDQFSNPKGYITLQHLITILCNPYKMIFNIKYRVASISIIHKPSFQAFGLLYFE